MLGIGPSDSFRISWKAILHPTPSQGATTVSSQVTGEHIPPHPQKSEATVSVKVCEDGADRGDPRRAPGTQSDASARSGSDRGACVSGDGRAAGCRAPASDRE